MSHHFGSWIKKIAECVHEHDRDPRKSERYRAMIREWAGEMVQNARPPTVPVREKLKRENPSWSDEQIEQHVRSLYGDILPDGTMDSAVNPEAIQYDPISVTADIATPLNKKYATLAAIHDASEHCSFPIDPWAGKHFDMAALCSPWADESPGPESVSHEERDEADSAMKYAHLKRCASELTDDQQANLERMLAEVAEDLQRHCGGDPTTEGGHLQLPKSEPVHRDIELEDPASVAEQSEPSTKPSRKPLKPPAEEQTGEAGTGGGPRTGPGAKEFGVMPNATAGMNLKEVLCRPYKTQMQFEERVRQRAALLVKQDRKDLTGAEESLLGAVANDKRSVAEPPADEAVWNLIRPMLQRAEDEINQQDDAQYKRRHYEPGALECALQRLEEVLRPLMRPGRFYITPKGLPIFVVAYCKAVLDHRSPPNEDLAREIEKLDRAGFTDELLRLLWQKCPGEAAHLELPKPEQVGENDDRADDRAAERAPDPPTGHDDSARDASPMPSESTAILTLEQIPQLDKTNGQWVTGVSVARAGRALKLGVAEERLPEKEAKRAVDAIKTARGSRRAQCRSQSGDAGIDQRGRCFRADPDDRKVFWYLASTTDGKKV